MYSPALRALGLGAGRRVPRGFTPAGASEPRRPWNGVPTAPSVQVHSVERREDGVYVQLDETSKKELADCDK